MKTNIINKSLAIILTIALITIGCSDESMTNAPITDPTDNSLQKSPSQLGNTIVDIAASDPANFSTLVTAVQEAGLVEILSGNRQFTVFAPTNAAFAKIPSELLNKIINNKEVLTKILLYHVAPGERFASDVLSSDKVRTMAKEFAYVNGTSIGNDTYGYANIAAPDVDAANGVIHVIEEVIIPPSLDLSQL